MSDQFNDQLKAELEDFLGDFEDDKSTTEEPTEDDKAPEENSEEEVVEEEVGEEETGTGEEDSSGDPREKAPGEAVEEGEVTTPAASEAVVPAEVLAQVEALRKQNEKLLEQVNKLSTIPREEGQQEPTKTDTPQAEGDVPDYVGGLDLDSLALDPQVLNGVLHNVVQTAVNKAVEKMLVNIPSVVQTQVKQQKTLNDAVSDFYNANEDLIPAKKVVAMFTNEVVAEHPDYSLEKVLEEAARKTRETLGIVKGLEPTTARNESGRRPALPKKPSSRTSTKKPTMTKLEQEIAELL